jgi:hypothetical protein
MYRIACVLALAAALALAGPTWASDPIGGFLIVDRVVLEPADAPTTIQVWGSITLASVRGGMRYANPQRGYLYYKAPAGKEAVCRKEWNDLKKAAGTGQVIGFGSSWDLKALGKIRPADRKPETPDPYPVDNGLVKFETSTEYVPVRTLLALPAPQTPVEGAVVPPGKVTLVARNIGDIRRARAKYVFELEGASGAKEEGTVDAGTKETRWTPSLKLKAGEKYTWRVRASEGAWKGPVATSSFVVKGAK